MRRFRLPSAAQLSRSLDAGFTLMEMLIVVGIVGLLSTVGVFSYNTAQRNTRDLQRMSALADLQKGMESYFAETGNYSCSETVLINSGVLPDGFPVDPKTERDMEFLSSVRQLFQPLASRTLIPQAYAQTSCAYCINTSAHQDQCIAEGGAPQFHLACNSKICCYKGSTPASPTPTPSPGGSGGSSPSPGTTPSPGSGGTSDQSEIESDELKYTLSLCTTSSYCACTRLERSGTGNASDRNCTWEADGDFYCLQQAQ